MKVKLWTMALVGLGMINVSNLAVKAESVDTAAVAYQQMIQQLSEGEYNGFTGQDLGYALYYVDADDVPELFVYFPNGGIDIYAMNNGECKYLMSIYGTYQDENDQLDGNRVFYCEGENSITVYCYGMEAGQEWKELSNTSIDSASEELFHNNAMSKCVDGNWYIGEQQVSEEQLDEVFFPENMLEITGDWEDASAMCTRLQNGDWPGKMAASYGAVSQDSEKAKLALELVERAIGSLQQKGKEEDYDEIYSVFYFKRAVFHYEVTAIDGNQAAVQVSIDAPDYSKKRDTCWSALMCRCYEEQMTSITEEDIRNEFFLKCLWTDPQPESLHYTGTLTFNVGGSEEEQNAVVDQLCANMDILPGIYNSVIAIPSEEEYARFQEMGYQQYTSSDKYQEQMAVQNFIEITDSVWGYMKEGNGILDSMRLTLGDAAAEDAKSAAGSDPLINQIIDGTNDVYKEHVQNHSWDEPMKEHYLNELDGH